jgi:sarcosine oxidase subunit alpha
MPKGRLSRGGRSIDRSAPIRFRFDGTEYEGFAGDTLASALLANGVDVVCRSPILGRPRGVMTAGLEEPCAFVEVSAPRFDPIVAATAVDVVEGLVAKGRRGVGELRVDPPAPRVGHRHRHVETLVVGGGAAGVTAAADAIARGDRVLLAERSTMWSAPNDLIGDDVLLLPGTTALGVYDQGYVVLHKRAGHEEIWHVRAERVVLATGAHERPIAFAGNDRPGVMLASATSGYVDRYGVLPGDRAVVFTTNDSTDHVVEVLRTAGAEIVAQVHARDELSVRAIEGDQRVSAVHLSDGRRVEADLLCVSGGWNPVTNLWRGIGGGLRYDGARACFVPDGDGPTWLSVVGAAAGGGLPETAPCWYVSSDDYSEHFVDFQRDQTVADVLAAVDGGLRSVEHVKRATYIGTAIDQGRTSGVTTAAIVNAALGMDPGAQGPTSARPPSVPVSYAALAGPDRGLLLDPIRTTPIHTWHVEHDAVFENVGQWKRSWYFSRDGESMQDAVARECLAVRTGVGMMDASTLGKIELVGSDAPAFLDRMYTNAMSTLRIGHIRYGLMLGLDGMAFDDGVAMRLAEDRYLLTTTTGGAAKVLDHFEEWLQTEWPGLRAFCTSVTEQWATVAIAGPRAREVLEAVGTSLDLSREAFPFMTFRDGEVAGVPARVARISFSGELAFEVNVTGWQGRQVWEALVAAGEPFGLTPYGTEAMHVLRAEKGFAIIGQDTDGTVTPYDLGMSWIVNETKGDFVGRRSLRRVDTARPDRKQLVALLPVDPQVLLPEGAQLVEQDTGRIPMPMLGHVTSSYRSAALGRTFALAMIERGRELYGRTLFAPQPEGTIAATVTEPVVYDPENLRRDGVPEG